MLSRTGYTRLHSPHFRLSPFSFWMRGFLQTGQTRMSRRSWGIMGSILRQPKAPRGDNEFRSIPGIDDGFYGQLEMRRIARDQAQTMGNRCCGN